MYLIAGDVVFALCTDAGQVKLAAMPTASVAVTSAVAEAPNTQELNKGNL